MGILINANGSHYFQNNQGEITRRKVDYFKNKNAVENLINYVLRTRKNEMRRADLKAWYAWGASSYSGSEEIINQFQYVQNIYGIEMRSGRKMYHFLYSFSDEERTLIGFRYTLALEIAVKQAERFWNMGFQTVCAVHDEFEKKLHIHFAVNAINYITGNKLHYNFNQLNELEADFNNITAISLRQTSPPNAICPIKFIDNSPKYSPQYSPEITRNNDCRMDVKRTTYWGIYSRSGLGVFNNQNLLENEKEFLKDYELAEFDSKEQAYCWVRDQYNTLQRGGDVDDIIETHSLDIKLNWIYFKKYIRKMNLESVI